MPSSGSGRALKSQFEMRSYLIPLLRCIMLSQTKNLSAYGHSLSSSKSIGTTIYFTARETCDWLFNDAQYKAWRDSPRGLFWIKGNPGAGKSVLMKYAFKRMQTAAPNDLVIAFFVHGQGTELQHTPLGIFRSLLNSLLCSYPMHLAELTTIFEDRERRFGGYLANRWVWSCQELQDTLTRTLTSSTGHTPVTIFIDALDECGEESARSLLAYFSELSQKIEEQQTHVRFCLSSRHYPVLGLDTAAAISVEDRNRNDIQYYVRQRLKSIQSKSKRRQIEDEILMKAQGGFQWAFLVTETIINRNISGTKVEHLQKELTSCPLTLSELYATILDAGSHDERLQTAKLFRWVLFSERPLSVQELREALATDQHTSYTSIAGLRLRESWSDTLTDFERHVKHVSKGLIKFHSREVWEQYEQGGEDSDREAQLIHQSVAEFLLDKYLFDAQQNQIGAGHVLISTSCFQYLTLPEVLEGSGLPRGTLCSNFPLVPYAVRYLFEHIHKADQAGIIQPDPLSTLDRTRLSETIRSLVTLWSIFDSNSNNNNNIPIGWPFAGSSKTHVWVALGLKNTIAASLTNDQTALHAGDADGNTPLHIAVLSGHYDIAVLLLDHLSRYRKGRKKHRDSKESVPKQARKKHQGKRVNKVRFPKPKSSPKVGINVGNADGETALDLALIAKAGTVISKLIDAGVDIRGRERSLLIHAIDSNDTTLIASLVARRVSLKGSVYYAVKTKSSEHVLRALLQSRADTLRPREYERDIGYDVSSNDDTNWDDALHLASRNGQQAMVNLLISYGASALYCNRAWECPLLIAVQQGSEGIIRSLLDYEPSAVNLADIQGRTVLRVAVESGRFDLVKLLIERGKFLPRSRILSDYLLKFGTFWVPASLELADRDYSMITERILIDGQLDLDARDERYRSILWHAAANGNDTLVQMLLTAKDINADAHDNTWTSPLLIAAWRGHTSVVKLLLATGLIDINWRNSTGVSTLLIAAWYGYSDIVELLLAADHINVNAGDETGCSPLLMAVWNGNMSIVDMLLSNEQVNVNAKDEQGVSPLLMAAGREHLGIFELLLATENTEINATDRDGVSPLHVAACTGQIIMAELLLAEDDVDLNIRDKHKRSPLHMAAWNGHIDIVVLFMASQEVDYEATDTNGYTPVHLAAIEGHVCVVEMLLDAQEESGPWDFSPLLWLAVSRRQLTVVDMLLVTGRASALTRNAMGYTLISHVMMTGDMAVFQLLINQNYQQQWNDKSDRSKLQLLYIAMRATQSKNRALAQEMLDAYEDGDEIGVRSTMDVACTPISRPICLGYAETVRRLLFSGKIDVDARDIHGRTPLWWAARSGYMRVYELIRSYTSRRLDSSVMIRSEDETSEVDVPEPDAFGNASYDPHMAVRHSKTDQRISSLHCEYRIKDENGDKHSEEQEDEDQGRAEDEGEGMYENSNGYGDVETDFALLMKQLETLRNQSQGNIPSRYISD
ncbi:ankyrin repeat-containing domain protein [Boeremia exigua]|uniref:ankyrin repeat-containing domain protein n=1 Tax=Boeremia exigua TaxID=749465 RepID=UPI001E8E6DF5|nr:ankyrin repeat-containing domain protein [Boeremia exigua]KAH6643709.1 ankyrin repeat-containing domain protein [Boeremia exigua]